MALQPHPTQDTDPSPDGLTGLSALLDGECSSAEAATLTRRWRQDTGLQRQWDTYHLIGDALRSEDLCRQGHGDRFMTGLRERLAAEPAIVAPAPLPRRAPARARWLRPVSAAAGVMAVAGSVWLLPVRQGVPTGSLAGASLTSTAATPTVATVTPPNNAARARPSGEWNRYLAAHQQFPGTAAVVPVSGYLRPADHDTADH